MRFKRIKFECIVLQYYKKGNVIFYSWKYHTRTYEEHIFISGRKRNYKGNISVGRISKV